MSEQATGVLDVCKTLTKLSLWAADDRLIANCQRPNDRLETGSYVGLDAERLGTFVRQTARALGALPMWAPSFLWIMVPPQPWWTKSVWFLLPLDYAGAEFNIGGRLMATLAVLLPN